MTYGREHHAYTMRNAAGAAVSHLAELVRGKFHCLTLNTPSSGPSDHLLPKGEKGHDAGLRNCAEVSQGRRAGSGMHA
jgi:hypothetical protein